MKIISSVINAGVHEEFLKEVPHKRFLDLAMVYMYPVDERGFGIITNMTCKRMKLTKKELDASAKEVTNYIVGNLRTFLGDIVPSDVEELLYIITTPSKSFGASVLANPSALKHFATQKDCDFYLLPSSIHEIIAVPKSSDMDIRRLKEIVRCVNGMIERDVYLSDNVYCYDRKRNKISIV